MMGERMTEERFRKIKKDSTPFRYLPIGAERWELIAEVEACWEEREAHQRVADAARVLSDKTNERVKVDFDFSEAWTELDAALAEVGREPEYQPVPPNRTLHVTTRYVSGGKGEPLKVIEE